MLTDNPHILNMRPYRGFLLLQFTKAQICEVLTTRSIEIERGVSSEMMTKISAISAVHSSDTNNPFQLLRQCSPLLVNTCHLLNLITIM